MTVLARTSSNIPEPEPMHAATKLKIFSGPSPKEEQLLSFDFANFFLRRTAWEKQFGVGGQTEFREYLYRF
jgi:hypothetical protein